MITKPYLIQRCFLKAPKTGDNFDGNFEMDYMGSSEFEFGTLPKSLQKFTGNLDEYKIIPNHNKNYRGQGLFFLSTSEIYKEYEQYIDDLVKDNIRLKEYSDIKHQHTGVDFIGKPINPNKIYLWWDVENHIMFAFGKHVVKTALKAITIVKENKKNDENWQKKGW